MGKGTIISGGTDGQYQVSVIYNTDRAAAEKAANLAKIANLEARIAAETDGQKLNILKLQKLSLEKRNEALDAIPESKDVTAWCADLTEDLTGDVGLIEVPGESVAVSIQPGHEGNAAYDATRDGQLTPTLAMTPAAAFYNLAMLPGWQKWKPTYRYGTITAISGDTADVTLDAATSTQQNLGVNQESTLTGVPVEYMSCNGAAFEAGDEVLVKFTGQDWSSPVVVGFKDNPVACEEPFYIRFTRNGSPTMNGTGFVIRFPDDLSNEYQKTYFFAEGEDNIAGPFKLGTMEEVHWDNNILVEDCYFLTNEQYTTAGGFTGSNFAYYKAATPETSDDSRYYTEVESSGGGLTMKVLSAAVSSPPGAPIWERIKQLKSQIDLSTAAITYEIIGGDEYPVYIIDWEIKELEITKKQIDIDTSEDSWSCTPLIPVSTVTRIGLGQDVYDMMYMPYGSNYLAVDTRFGSEGQEYESDTRLRLWRWYGNYTNVSYDITASNMLFVVDEDHNLIQTPQGLSVYFDARFGDFNYISVWSLDGGGDLDEKLDECTIPDFLTVPIDPFMLIGIKLKDFS